MVDMSTIDMLETQEDTDNENNKDKEPGEIDSVLAVTLVTDTISCFVDVDDAMHAS
jgi:hypothetical protein